MKNETIITGKTKTKKMGKRKIIIVCEHCEDIAIFSDSWETLHLAEDYECFKCGHKNKMKNETTEYECEDCEDGENLVEGSECFHCGNENGELKK